MKAMGNGGPELDKHEWMLLLWTIGIRAPSQFRGRGAMTLAVLGLRLYEFARSKRRAHGNPRNSLAGWDRTVAQCRPNRQRKLIARSRA